MLYKMPELILRLDKDVSDWTQANSDDETSDGTTSGLIGVQQIQQRSQTQEPWLICIVACSRPSVCLRSRTACTAPCRARSCSRGLDVDRH